MTFRLAATKAAHLAFVGLHVPCRDFHCLPISNTQNPELPPDGSGGRPPFRRPRALLVQIERRLIGEGLVHLPDQRVVGRGYIEVQAAGFGL